MYSQKRFLFYLVHPAKYHFHKIQINKLISNGHIVDIVINTKDILEQLVQEEGWEYTNIFPNSRKIKGVHRYVAAFISIFLTVWRLLKYTKGKKYDLFVGDLTTILGRIKNTPSLYPTDDVLTAVPEQAIFFKTVNYIIAPVITDVGKYSHKKIGYAGYKALAHLHPNHFKPDKSVLSPVLQDKKYFLIRCTGFTATHDIGKSGITDDVLQNIVNILNPYGQILITSERTLPANLEKYRISIRKNDITHYLSHAEIFISDSTTMSTEAAVLGTPSVEFDEYFWEIEQMMEIAEKYNLIHLFRVTEKEQFYNTIKELAVTVNLKHIYERRRDKLLNDTIDVSAFLIWLFENYPDSKNKYFLDTNIQYQFK